MPDGRNIATRDVCALLGITPQTIRLYEKYIDALRYDFAENGYRSFNFQSVSLLSSFRSLSTMGMGLSDAADVVNAAQPDEILETYDRCIDRLKQEAARLERLRKVVEHQRSLVELIKTSLGAYQVTMMPNIYWLPCEQDGKMVSDARHRELMRKWGESIPFAHFLTYIDGKTLSHYSVARIGLAIPEEFSDLVPLDGEFVRRIGGCRCISSISRVQNVALRARGGTGGFDDYYCTVEGTVKWAKSHGLDITGDAYGRVVAVRVTDTDGTDNDYYYGWMPLAEDATR